MTYLWHLRFMYLQFLRLCRRERVTILLGGFIPAFAILVAMPLLTIEFMKKKYTDHGKQEETA